MVGDVALGVAVAAVVDVRGEVVAGGAAAGLPHLAALRRGAARDANLVRGEADRAVRAVGVEDAPDAAVRRGVAEEIHPAAHAVGAVGAADLAGVRRRIPELPCAQRSCAGRQATQPPVCGSANLPLGSLTQSASTEQVGSTLPVPPCPVEPPPAPVVLALVVAPPAPPALVPVLVDVLPSPVDVVPPLPPPPHDAAFDAASRGAASAASARPKLRVRLVILLFAGLAGARGSGPLAAPS